MLVSLFDVHLEKKVVHVLAAEGGQATLSIARMQCPLFSFVSDYFCSNIMRWSFPFPVNRRSDNSRFWFVVWLWAVASSSNHLIICVTSISSRNLLSIPLTDRRSYRSLSPWIQCMISSFLVFNTTPCIENTCKNLLPKKHEQLGMRCNDESISESDQFYIPDLTEWSIMWGTLISLDSFRSGILALTGCSFLSRWKQMFQNPLVPVMNISTHAKIVYFGGVFPLVR